MNIQKFLREGGTIESLEKDYKIKTTRHKTHQNLVLFKYKDTCSKYYSVYVQEARGLVLDEEDDYKIISYPYDRFYNNGETYAQNVNFNCKWRLYSKMDGMLTILYWYPKANKWYVSSSGIPDASGILNNGVSIDNTFWRIFNKLGYELPEDKNICYIFELIDPYNPIVIRYDEENLILHGARNMTNYKELDPIEICKKTGFNCVNVIMENDHNIKIKDIKRMVSSLDHKKYEGFVFCDENYNRLKIKSNKYVKLSHNIEVVKCFGRRNIKLEPMIKIFFNPNEKSEVLAVCPELKEHMDYIHTGLDKIKEMILLDYQSLLDIKSDKIYYEKCKDYWCEPALRLLRKKSDKNIDCLLKNCFESYNKIFIQKLREEINKK